MRLYSTLVLISAAIINCIECSSQSDGNSHSERNPGPSSTVKQRISDGTPTEEPPLRKRSGSPVAKPPAFKIFGCSLKQLGYIRLIPRTNQDLTFEFRNYIFPAGLPISWRADKKRFSLVPAQEHIVLSASNGDIFAILAYRVSLCGMYRTLRHNPRAKMNMISGAIDNMSPDEIRDCPVGKIHSIARFNFIKTISKSDSLKSKWNTDNGPDPAPPSSAREHSSAESTIPEEPLIRAGSISSPGRPPQDQVLGYTMEQLGYVRLIPCTNHNQEFEFRRYVFPFDKPIRMRINEKGYVFGPTQEYIALSTYNSDVFAILDHSGTLRGIYRKGRTHPRVKINMISGAVDDMTPDEIRDCPVGKNYPPNTSRFTRVFSNYNSLRSEQNSGIRSNFGSDRLTKKHTPSRTSTQEPTLDARSSSPPGRPPSHDVLGYPLAKFGYIRLIPQMNPNRRFEFRRYVFSSAKGIHLMLEDGQYVPVPTREHIVLSTSNGDVFAILEYTEILRGVYQMNRATNGNYSRIRINMITGEVAYMTEFEMKECHVGNSYPILPRWFIRVVSERDSLQILYH